jgi:hypothetical protein
LSFSDRLLNKRIRAPTLSSFPQGSTQGRLDSFFKVLPGAGTAKRKVRVVMRNSGAHQMLAALFAKHIFPHNQLRFAALF